MEAPSQMLENWCWERDALLRMMGHYKDPAKKLADDKIAALIKTKEAMPAVFNKRQLVFGLLDQRMHTQAKVDTAALYAAVLKEVMGFTAPKGPYARAWRPQPRLLGRVRACVCVCGARSRGTKRASPTYSSFCIETYMHMPVLRTRTRREQHGVLLRSLGRGL